MFTNTPAWKKYFPYATFAPQSTAEASLRPGDRNEDILSEIRVRYYAAESSATNDVSRQVAEGNPTPAATAFYYGVPFLYTATYTRGWEANLMDHGHTMLTGFPEDEDSEPEDGPKDEKCSNPWAEAASSAWKSFHDDIQSQFDEGQGAVIATATIMEQTLTVTMTNSEGWDRSFPYHLPSSWPHSPRDFANKA